jgi:hypothetical protein
MSILETTAADLESAVQAARAVAALIPRIKQVGLLRTVPGSTHAARDVFVNSAVAAWQTAALTHAKLVAEQNTEDCRINWAGCVSATQSERSLAHLEHMTVFKDWMTFDMSQDAIDAMDGDK